MLIEKGGKIMKKDKKEKTEKRKSIPKSMEKTVAGYKWNTVRSR